MVVVEPARLCQARPHLSLNWLYIQHVKLMAMTRTYRLGRRQTAIDRTLRTILAAARELVAEQPAAAVSVASIARRAGVSRITVYNRFGPRAAVLGALAPPRTVLAPRVEDPHEALRAFLHAATAAWSAYPGLYRHLPAVQHSTEPDEVRALVERLAASDALRPGCSLREAEDVIGALSSFAVFDRLYRDGRRPASAVADVLMRLASGILA